MTQPAEIMGDTADGNKNVFSGIYVHPEHPITPESFDRLVEVAAAVNAAVGKDSDDGFTYAYSPPQEEGGPDMAVDLIDIGWQDIKVLNISSEIGNLEIIVQVRNNAGTISDRQQPAASLSLRDRNSAFIAPVYETPSLADGDIALLSETIDERLRAGSFVKHRRQVRQ